jgi:hypothetical protein
MTDHPVSFEHILPGNGKSIECRKCCFLNKMHIMDNVQNCDNYKIIILFNYKILIKVYRAMRIHVVVFGYHPPDYGKTFSRGYLK